MTRKWNLWIDDLRNPRLFDRLGWEEMQYIWASTVEQAIYFCQLWGPPEFMALDHDLGTDYLGNARSVPEFLDWLQRNHPDSPPRYSIHTANPEAGANMRAFMESWKKSLED